MKFACFVLFLSVFYLSYIDAVNSCSRELTALSLNYKISHDNGDYYRTCWKIKVPQGTYIKLDIVHLNLDSSASCSQQYITVKLTGTNQTLRYCSYDNTRKPVIAVNDVIIECSIKGIPSGWSYEASEFEIAYKIEDIMCTQTNHFRCSDHFCIDKKRVCDRIDDCENEADETGCDRSVAAVKGVTSSLQNAISWLKSQRLSSFGWGKNTHRAITSLYLAGAVKFRGDNLEEELIAKQLDLQASVALLRNSTDPLSLSDTSMFANALTVTCHNPEKFYGHDLLQNLIERIDSSKSPNPGAYLTLCNSNKTFSESYLHDLLYLLREPSEYPFFLDVEAMTIMALTCARNKMKNFEDIINATELYDATTEKFIAGQLPDGSFGNVYTTALVTQALIASGQESNKAWNLTSTVQYLMQHLSSSPDFFSVYYTLPILNGKSLVDIKTVNCNNPRKKREDVDIADLRNKLGGKMRIQYSLYVGDQKDVIHTIFLRAPENSSVYDIMRLAQVADTKYRFLHRQMSGQMYIYEIAGITNDPEAGKFWLLYIEGSSDVKETFQHRIQSPDKIILNDGEHLVMWYKTVHFTGS